MELRLILTIFRINGSIAARHFWILCFCIASSTTLKEWSPSQKESLQEHAKAKPQREIPRRHRAIRGKVAELLTYGSESSAASRRAIRCRRTTPPPPLPPAAASATWLSSVGRDPTRIPGDDTADLDDREPSRKKPSSYRSPASTYLLRTCPPQPHFLCVKALRLVDFSSGNRLAGAIDHEGGARRKRVGGPHAVSPRCGRSTRPSWCGPHRGIGCRPPRA